MNRMVGNLIAVVWRKTTEVQWFPDSYPTIATPHFNGLQAIGGDVCGNIY